jgi:transposase
MTKKTAQKHFSESGETLYLAFELSSKDWKLGFSIGLGQKPRIRTVASGDLSTLRSEIKLARKRFRLSENCPVKSCYEAGRDGFWLHRFLIAEGIENFVVDSSSIEVNRRARRAKADRLDAISLVRMLIRYCDQADRRVWSVVRVPSEEDEDNRQLHREISALQKELNRTNSRIRGLLMTQGIRLGGHMDLSDLEAIRMWDGKPLRPGLRQRIGREWEHFLFLKKQICTLKRQRRNALSGKDESQPMPEIGKIRQLQSLRGIGEVSAWQLVGELFGWREFDNRRQLGSVSGLTPTPYQSGDTNREQGISKAGIVPVRQIAIELAWGWLRFQPDSKLSRWYNQRFAYGGKKARKIGIVALARKLLIELWRFLETGAVPEGAQLKSPA